MPDVTTRNEREAAYAAETAVVTKFFHYLPEERKREARHTLRRVAKSDPFKTDDGMANVALEELWNILAGND